MKKTFPDKANYRIEVSGIETAAILEAVVDEAKKEGIPIHRAVATVRGSMHYSDKQLKELARVAAENKVEVIMCCWDLLNKVIRNPYGCPQILNPRSAAETITILNEIERCANLGFQGFLVWVPSLLVSLNQNRLNIFPEDDIVIKCSTFMNLSNRFDVSMVEMLGADSVNVVNGLTLDQLAEIRGVTPVSLDLHMTFWDSFHELNEKGEMVLKSETYQRIREASEIAEICSPVHFKFEKGTPGLSVYDAPRPDWTFEDLAKHKREDVWTAANVVRKIEKEKPCLKLSDWGPEDLRVPVIKKRR